MVKRTLLMLILAAAMAAAQDFTGMKFYINPGHGGNDPANDRYIPETGLWESESNLTKGLYIRDLLRSRGAQVIMSRVTNYDRDDRGLSDIAAEANANNVDILHSIHSNATGTTTPANYTLMLFRGYDNQPVFPAAKSMSQALYGAIHAANRTVVFNSGVRGDWSFYTSWGTQGLGVLRPLTMPGVLSEGSFHDYIPESFRLTSIAYRQHEAACYLRAYAQFYAKGPVPYGTLAGVARDPLHNISWTLLSALPDDAKMPVNNIVVRLEPGGRIFRGDAKNNGFFFFDSVAAGNYTLHISAAGYGGDSARVTVKSNQANFQDFFLVDTSAPRLLSWYPDAAAEAVRISTPVQITFSTRMDRASTEAAFSIDPPVAGRFSWSDYDQQLTFTAARHFDPGTTYRVTLAASAANRFGAPLENPLVFEFVTDMIGRFALDSCYPAAGTAEISPTVQVQLRFNYPVLRSTLNSNLFVTDAGGSRAVIVRSKVYEEAGKGRIDFEFKSPLARAGDYLIQVNGPVSSTWGISLIDTLRIPFRVEAAPSGLETVLDRFNNLYAWSTPAATPWSYGIDTLATKVILGSDRAVSAATAARLSWVFQAERSAVALPLNPPLALGNNAPGSKLGLHLFGDLCGHQLTFLFKGAGDSLIAVPVDTVDWTGWKLRYLYLDRLPAGTAFFVGVQLVRLAGGAAAGEVGLDDFSMGQLTGVEQTGEIIPQTTTLAQNYPNPFNPATTIPYTLARPGRVTLAIYSLTGSRIRTLVERRDHPAGLWQAEWDGRNQAGMPVPSGIYYCTLRGETGSQTRKLVLVR